MWETLVPPRKRIAKARLLESSLAAEKQSHNTSQGCEAQSFELFNKIDTLKTTITSLKAEIKRLTLENEELDKVIKRSKRISKGLLLMLYENGIVSEEQSAFTLFRDVCLHVRSRKSM